MKAICPKNKKHKRFLTTAHVMQEWEVDENGEFRKVTGECLDVTSQPDSGNIWRCAICGEEAKVLDVDN